MKLKDQTWARDGAPLDQSQVAEVKECFAEVSKLIGFLTERLELDCKRKDPDALDILARKASLAAAKAEQVVLLDAINRCKVVLKI
jgi:hypothetical protein